MKGNVNHNDHILGKVLRKLFKVFAQIDRKLIAVRPGKVWPRLVAYFLFEGRPLTTRGRWINPIVLAAHRLWAHVPMRQERLEPIYILGTGRSGTTILGNILGLHRDVGFLNEPKGLWHAAIGDEDVIGSYSEVPGRFRLTGDDASPEKIKKLHNSYRAFLAISKSRRVLDKYPELIFRNGLLDAAFPNARKLVIIRNGADTIQSIANWSARHCVGTGECQDNWWGRNDRKWKLLVEQLVAPDPFFAPALPNIAGIKDHLNRAAVEWITMMRQLAKLRAENCAGLHVVQYERLLEFPDETLDEILKFCGLEHDPKMLKYAHSVLSPPSDYAAPELDDAIQPLFEEAMGVFGFQRAA